MSKNNILLTNEDKTLFSRRILVGVPMTGLLRSEFVLARYGQAIPANWSAVDMIQFIDQYSPLKYLVADARNIIASNAVEKEFEWLIFIDHDVVLPQGTLLSLNERMTKGDIPMMSGLYFTKSVPSDPLVYRGRGNSYYKNWKMGDEVWVDGIPMGITLIHGSVLKVLYEESEEYSLGGIKVRKIFETPSKTFRDPEKNGWYNLSGTEDLELCSRIMRDGIFKKAGWPKFQKKEFPFMIDTAIFCRHISPNGDQFPMRGEELQFMGKKTK